MVVAVAVIVAVIATVGVIATVAIRGISYAVMTDSLYLKLNSEIQG